MNEDRMAVMYGPLVLAADFAHNPEICEMQAGRLRYIGPAAEDGVPRFTTDGIICEPGIEPARFTLTLVPYYAVGADGSEFVVWMKRPQREEEA